MISKKAGKKMLYFTFSTNNIYLRENILEEYGSIKVPTPLWIKRMTEHKKLLACAVFNVFFKIFLKREIELKTFFHGG